MKYIVANWKMKLSAKQVYDWIETWKKLNGDSQTTEGIEVIVCPSFIHIPLVRSAVEAKSGSLKLGSQDVSSWEIGSHTGDQGAFQLRDFVEYSIIGHSERKESTDEVLLKATRCNQNDIKTITCFVNSDDAKIYQEKSSILAWEDPQNISVNGEYREKDPEEIVKGINEIRNRIGSDIKLLYGGSVNRQNIQNLVNIKGLDGVLIGNASLDPEHFIEIIKAYS